MRYDRLANSCHSLNLSILIASYNFATKIINTQKLTMKLKDLEPQLLALTPAEKFQAIQLLTQSLANIWSGIEKTPGVCGGNACIAGTRIPIWVLVNARRLGVSESELLQDYPSLQAADLVNAWTYAEVYSQDIELAIRENEEI